MTSSPKIFNPNLGLSRESPFGVSITDVQKPIIGAEFLPRFHLFVNFKDCSLHNNLLSFHIIFATNILGSLGLHVLLPVLLL